MVIIPNVPIYVIPPVDMTWQVYLWAVVASPVIGFASVAFVRAIAWADRARPTRWLRIVVPPAVFLGLGLVSIPFPETLGNGQDVAEMLFVRGLPALALILLLPIRPLCTVAAFASGAPGGLFTPSLAAGALAGAALGALWSAVVPGGQAGAFALLGAGAMLAATTQGPISSLVLMIELTGQARAFALPMLIVIAGATLTARSIELRSIYEARLTDAEVAERARARDASVSATNAAGSGATPGG